MVAFYLNETGRFYPRLGWFVVNNSFGSGEGEKMDWEECLKCQHRHIYMVLCKTTQKYSEINITNKYAAEKKNQ